MQNLFLKSLVLIGVIGGSCYVVWQAHENLQDAPVETDPNQFVSLDPPDGENEEDEGLSPQPEELGGIDLGFENPDDPQDAPSHTEEVSEIVGNDPQPTVAKPLEFTPKLADRVAPQVDSAPKSFPPLTGNANVRPIEDVSSAESFSGLPDQSPETDESPEMVIASESKASTELEPHSAAPVMPQSYYSASGKQVPSVAMLGNEDDPEAIEAIGVVPVSAEEPAENISSGVTLAGFETTSGENSEPNKAPPAISFGPSANQDAPTLTAPRPFLPSQENSDSPKEQPGEKNEPLSSGLTRLPRSQPGPVLLPPEALPTLGQRENSSGSSSTTTGIVTADGLETGKTTISPASGEAANPFAGSQSPPTDEEPVVPSSLGTNPFAKKSPAPMAPSELKPITPSDAGFNTPAPTPTAPEVSPDPFARAPKTAEVPPVQPENTGIDLFPPRTIPPAKADPTPQEATNFPELPLPPKPGESSVPATSGLPPRMVEPEPLRSLAPKEKVPLTGPPAEPDESPVLPGNLLPINQNELPTIRPAERDAKSFSAGTSLGNPPASQSDPTSTVSEDPSVNSTGTLRNPYFTEAPAPTPRTSNQPPASTNPFAKNPVPPGPGDPNSKTLRSSIPEPAMSRGPGVFPGSNVPMNQEPTPVTSGSGVFPLGQAGGAPEPNRPEFEKLSNSTPEPTLATPKATNNVTGNSTLEPTVATGPQSPELKIEKIAPSEAAIGEPLIYSIRIRNVGQSTARSVVVEDRIPRGTRLEGTIPQAVQTDEKLSWELGVLPAGEERTIQLKVTPLEPGNIGSVATVSFEASVAANIRVTAPELSVEIDGPTEALLGKNVPYQFTVRNTGQGDAKDVVLRAILPPSLKHPNGNDIEADLNDIPAGKTKTVELVVVADEVGVSTPKVLIWMGGKNLAENRADLRILESRLRITRTGPKRRFVGRTAQFASEITNDSSTTLNNISILEHLPVSVEPAPTVTGWDPQRRVIQRTIPSLLPGQTKQIVTEVIPKQAGDLTGKLIAQDLNGNRAEVATPLSVKGFAELEAVVHGENKIVEVGEQVSLRLKLKNDGTASATNVQAAFEIPAGLTFSNASGPSEYDVYGNRVIFKPVQKMPTNTEKTYDIVLTAAETGEKKVKVALISDDYEEAINREEPVRVISTSP